MRSHTSVDSAEPSSSPSLLPRKSAPAGSTWPPACPAHCAPHPWPTWKTPPLLAPAAAASGAAGALSPPPRVLPPRPHSPPTCPSARRVTHHYIQYHTQRVRIIYTRTPSFPSHAPAASASPPPPAPSVAAAVAASAAGTAWSPLSSPPMRKRRKGTTQPPQAKWPRGSPAGRCLLRPRLRLRRRRRPRASPAPAAAGTRRTWMCVTHIGTDITNGMILLWNGTGCVSISIDLTHRPEASRHCAAKKQASKPQEQPPALLGDGSKNWSCCCRVRGSGESWDDNDVGKRVT